MTVNGDLYSRREDLFVSQTGWKYWRVQHRVLFSYCIVWQLL